MNYVRRSVWDVIVSVLFTAAILFMLQHYFSFKFPDNAKYFIAIIVVVCNVGISINNNFKLVKRISINLLSTIVITVLLCVLYKFIF